MRTHDFKLLMGVGFREWGHLHNLPEHTVYNSWKRGRSHLQTDKSRSNHPLYGSYKSILARCYNPNHKAYPNYGGRGIYMCSRWFYSFDAFAEDMGDRPEGYSIDRIDNDDIYRPANCRWASFIDQNNNRRSSLDIPGVYLTGRGWQAVHQSQYLGFSKDRHIANLILDQFLEN